jgi:hypothetical protein
MAQQAAHEHGVGRAQVALDGRDLLINLQIPAHDLLGFEHAPQRPEELQKLSALRHKWSRTEAWVQLNGNASCVQRSFDLQVGADAQNEGGPHDHDHHHHDDNHHEHANTPSEHADVQIALVFQCQAPEQISEVRLNPFALVSTLQELRYESIWPTGQGSGRLRPQQLSVKLSDS